MNENIKIRLATYEDCKKLPLLQLEIWETTFRGIYPDEKFDNFNFEIKQKKFESFIDSSFQQLYVVTDNGELVGYFEFGKPYRPFQDYTQEIGLLYLKKDYQKQGLGRKMFDIAVKHIKETGIDKFFISCNKFNLNAQNFYLKMGGRVVHIDEDDANDGVPQIKYEYLIK